MDMGKGTGPGFLPYGQRPELMTHVSKVLGDSKWLRSATLPREKKALPALYNAVNTAHAFVKATGGRSGSSSTDLVAGTGVQDRLDVGSWWPLLGLPVIILLVDRFVIAREEVYLRTRFGADYDDFCARTRRWL